MDLSTTNLSTDVLSRREGEGKTVHDERAEWMDIDDDIDIEISPTEEMRVMGDDEQLQFWRQIWSQRTEPMEYDVKQSGTSFYDLKAKAWAALKRDQYRMFEAYVIP
eukprot:5192039-Amphidinium_carterae.1